MLPVDHVSDTAYLVAMYRSYESDREDAKFRDPFAKILSAPKAQMLEKAIPLKEEGHWMMTVRTVLIDEHILRLVKEGVDTIVNLAAGLDTRPYRLDLPQSLNWIEADFPAITKYKAESLAAETPRCQLQRIVVDLSNDEARRKLFRDFSEKAKRTLVITEGLLPYLSQTAIRSLATDLHATRTVRYWLMDVTNTDFIQQMSGGWAQKSDQPHVVLNSAPQEGAGYYESLGWKIKSFQSFLEGSEKIGRTPPASMTTNGQGAISGNSGVALLVSNLGV